MKIELTPEKLRINYKAREWCRLPYPDHPEGCPNYGQRDTCPPDAPMIGDFLRIDLGMFLIIVEFDLASHVQRMMQKHPNWSERQAKCVLYWQGGVNAQLERECKLFRWSHPDMITTRCPEAMGVNVIATAQLCGLPIKPKPEGKVYKIALAGISIVF